MTTPATTETTTSSHIAENPQTQAGSNLLGTLINPNVRRFYLLLGSLNVPKLNSKQSYPTLTVNFNPYKLNQVDTFIRFHSNARLKSMQIIFFPSGAAPALQVSGLAAWFPSVDKIPDSWDAFGDLPLTESVIMGPVARGGIVAPVKLAASFDYGVQAQFKPLPLVGGPPRFSARLSLQALDKDAMPEEGKTVVDFFVELVVEGSFRV